MINYRKNLNFVFWGTGKFASDILEILIQNDYFPKAIITVEDKKVGRKQILESPYIKKTAEKYSIPVLQFANIKNNQELINYLKNLDLDLNIVAQYGKIIPLEILNIPKFKSINVHGSLLSKYRGASPVQTALLNGDKETGVTLIQMDEKMDHGAIIAQKAIKIDVFDTAETLLDKLAILGGYLLVQNLGKYIDCDIKLKEQNHNEASYTKIIKKNDGLIDISTESAEKIYNKFRAFYPWPGIFLFWNNKRLKIIEIEPYNCSGYDLKDINDFFYINKNTLLLKAKNSCLKVNKLQLEGKKIQLAKDFINAYKNKITKIN